MALLMTSNRKPSASTAAVSLAAWHFQLWVGHVTFCWVGALGRPWPKCCHTIYRHRSKIKHMAHGSLQATQCNTVLYEGQQQD